MPGISFSMDPKESPDGDKVKGEPSVHTCITKGCSALQITRNKSNNDNDDDND